MLSLCGRGLDHIHSVMRENGFLKGHIAHIVLLVRVTVVAVAV